MTVTAKETTGAEAIRWDLKDLFSGIEDPALDKILSDSKTLAENFQTKYKGTLETISASELTLAYKLLEDLYQPLYKADQFAGLIYATDTSNDTVKALVAKIEDVESEVANFTLFFELELAQLSEEKSKALESAPEMATYAYLLEQTRKTSSYNLTEKEEQLINIKDLTGKSAFKKLYSDITSAFEFEFELDGKVQKMNGSQLRALRSHEKADVRRRAMKLFYSKYEEQKMTLGTIYNNIIKDYELDRKKRGYETSISKKNSGNDLDDKAVQVLHDTTTKSAYIVQRYYQLKKTIINLPDLTLADIYAPMPESSKKYSYDEAKTMVLDSFKAFDSEFYDMAKLMFDENRIHAPVEPKKRGGAFCSGYTPDVKPYVMLNFLGKPRDVSTMAHELGHAIHDLLASKQTLFNYHPILPLAETASVFCEMIVTDMLLKNETDDEARQNILTDKLEDIFATSHRQNMFSKFEMKTHDKIAEGLMNPDELCAAYREELDALFGDAVVKPDEYKWEWSTIPHIHESPYYVYAYNFGNLLVMALYQQYLEEGDAFIPKLKAFLGMGGSRSPKEITQVVGVDITDPSFWQKSIVYIESLLTELEGIVKK